MVTGFTGNWQAGADITDEFARFKHYCQLIFTGPYSKKSDVQKSSYILIWIGHQGVDIYNSFMWANDNDKIDAIFGPNSKNILPLKLTLD